MENIKFNEYTEGQLKAIIELANREVVAKRAEFTNTLVPGQGKNNFSSILSYEAQVEHDYLETLDLYNR